MRRLQVVRTRIVTVQTVCASLLIALYPEYPEAPEQRVERPAGAQTPAPETPEAKEAPPPPTPKPANKKVAKERPLETVEPVLMDEIVADVEKVTEQTPSQPTSPTATQSMKNSLPTPVPIFQLTQAPSFLHREKPIYPEVMRVGGISGVVKLEALIDSEGRVREVNILKSAGEHFDEAAREAVLASTFYPAKIENEPVAVLLRLPVKFSLL